MALGGCGADVEGVDDTVFESIRKMAKLIRRLKKHLAVLAGLRRNF